MPSLCLTLVSPPEIEEKLLDALLAIAGNEAFPRTPTSSHGTDHARPRCAALTGQVGQRVACGIYEWRPSPCQEFAAGSDACQRARQRHGLPPLTSDVVW